MSAAEKMVQELRSLPLEVQSEVLQVIREMLWSWIASNDHS